MARRTGKKKANLGIFHILNAIVDYQVPKLQARVVAAKSAANEIPKIEQDINDIEFGLTMARCYDRSEVEEFEESLETYGARLTKLKSTVADGRVAANNLRAAGAFNKTFLAVIAEQNAARIMAARRKRIADLWDCYHSLAAKEQQMDGRIESCDINMSTHPAGSEIYQQSRVELDYWENASRELGGQMGRILAQIRELEQENQR